MIEAVIFDIGGVLLDYGKKKRYEHVLAPSFGVPEEDIVKNIPNNLDLLQRGDISEKEYWERFASKIGKPSPADYDTLWHRAFIETSEVNKEMVDLVMQIKKDGYKVATLSNTIDSHAKLLRKIYNADMFDAFVLSNEIRTRKPDEWAYREALRRLECKPEKSVYIDDDMKFVTPARELGIHGILFQSREKLKIDLDKILLQNL